MLHPIYPLVLPPLLSLVRDPFTLQNTDPLVSVSRIHCASCVLSEVIGQRTHKKRICWQWAVARGSARRPSSRFCGCSFVSRGGGELTGRAGCDVLQCTCCACCLCVNTCHLRRCAGERLPFPRSCHFQNDIKFSHITFRPALAQRSAAHGIARGGNNEGEGHCSELRERDESRPGQGGSPRPETQQCSRHCVGRVEGGSARTECRRACPSCYSLKP